MLVNQSEKYNLDLSVCYLNMAYMSPSLKAVSKAGIQSINEKENPYTITADKFFEGPKLIKELFAKVVDCDDAERIALIPSASYGIATVANNVNLKSGDEILVLEEQFPSNVYSWKRLANKCQAKIVTVQSPSSAQNKAEVWNENVLAQINSSTKIVALPHCHWAEGSLFDLVKIRAKCTEVGALLIVDASQSIGALPFSINEVKPDMLVSVSYKWLGGPYSSAYAYFGEYFDNGIPLEENWMQRYNSEDFRTLVEYEERYKDKAARYNVGQSSNFLNIPMQLVALKQINEWGTDNIQDYCDRISKETIKELRQNGYFIDDDKFRAKHLFGIKLKEATDINKLKQSLHEQKIIVSLRGDYMRVSPYLYNDESDFEKLKSVLLSH